MRFFRRRVRAKVAGNVVSIKRGSRVRIAVATADGVDYYLATDPTVKIGKKVRKGAVLGKI